MKKRFTVFFLQEVHDFLASLDGKTQEKIIYNVTKAQFVKDAILFKKLTNNIWEFRTLYKKQTYRLFAFWDKTGAKEVLVIATHGILKKTKKTPKKELEKAEKIRTQYFLKK